jgi:hypothetical protein
LDDDDYDVTRGVRKALNLIERFSDAGMWRDLSDVYHHNRPMFFMDIVFKNAFSTFMMIYFPASVARCLCVV